MSTRSKLILLHSILYNISLWRNENNTCKSNEILSKLHELCYICFKDSEAFYMTLISKNKTDEGFISDLEHFALDFLGFHVINLPYDV